MAILNHFPDVGGAETSILTLLRNMDRSRFQVTVVVPSSGSFSRALDQIDVKVDVISLPRSLLVLRRGNALKALLLLTPHFFSLHFFLIKLCAYLKKNRFDLVLTNSVKAHLYGSLAARLCSIPLVWRFHDVLSIADFSPLLIKGLRSFGNLFPTKILAVSNAARDHLIMSGLSRRKVEVIFTGVDRRDLEGEEDLKSLREELGLEDGMKLVGCIGRIIPEKGQRSFLLAIPRVLDQYPETLFVVVGDALLKEGSYQEELRNIIHQRGIEGKVQFTGFRTDMRNVIRSLDLVVFPSVAPESFGLSILEAMSLGKPVIASDLGGVRELIEDRVTGLLIRPGDPEQIADRIIDLFRDKKLYEKIGAKARERTEQFSMENYVSSMEEACQTAALRKVKH